MKKKEHKILKNVIMTIFWSSFPVTCVLLNLQQVTGNFFMLALLTFLIASSGAFHLFYNWKPSGHVIRIAAFSCFFVATWMLAAGSYIGNGNLPALVLIAIVGTLQGFPVITVYIKVVIPARRLTKIKRKMSN
jgi:hypothetical protein